MEGSAQRVAVSTNRLLRWTYLSLGFLFVALGVAGIFLPLVPTGDFLVLATGFFAASSPTVHRWMYTNRVFGTYLRNYREHRGATMRTKVVSIAVLWIGISVSAYLVPLWWIDLGLLAVAVGVTWHLVRLKTIRG